VWSKLRFKDPFLFDKDINRIIYEIREKYGFESVDYLGIRLTGKMLSSERETFIHTKIVPLVILEYGKYIESVNEHKSKSTTRRLFPKRVH